jgi:predicted nuclease of restriction endonuclease-like (RecB) superfamily
MSGLSERNLIYMRSFAQAWPDPTALEGPLGQVQWGHMIVMLDKLHDRQVRECYAERIANSGWSRAVLTHQIKSRLHERIGAAPSNFPATLADEDSDYTAQLLKDPYNFDFLGITERIAERDLEQRLMNSVQEFLLELGDGFALYKRQDRFMLGGKEFVIDLVFFNVLQNRCRCPLRPCSLNNAPRRSDLHLRQTPHRCPSRPSIERRATQSSTTSNHLNESRSSCCVIYHAYHSTDQGDQLVGDKRNNHRR